MYVVKEPLGLATLPSPTPWAFTLGKRKKGGAIPSLCSFDFYTKKYEHQPVQSWALPDLPRPCQTLLRWAGDTGLSAQLWQASSRICGLAGQSVDRLQRRYQQVGDSGWQCPRGEITACAWGGGPGGVCLWAQVEPQVPQYFLRGHLEPHGQHTVDFQVAALGTELDAEPEGQ